MRPIGDGMRCGHQDAFIRTGTRERARRPFDGVVLRQRDAVSNAVWTIGHSPPRVSLVRCIRTARTLGQ